MSTVLYTTHCPNCKHLEFELKRAGVDYEIVSDTTKMIGFGFISAPMLEVDGKTLTYSEALCYIRSLNERQQDNNQ